MLPQEAGRPEDTRVEAVQFLAAAAAVETTELRALRPIVIGGIFLDIFELVELDVAVEEDVTEGVGLDHREDLQRPGNLDVRVCESTPPGSMLSSLAGQIMMNKPSARTCR